MTGGKETTNGEGKSKTKSIFTGDVVVWTWWIRKLFDIFESQSFARNATRTIKWFGNVRYRMEDCQHVG